MKGRPPKPAKLKILHGNPGKRDIQPEPKATDGFPDMPCDLDPIGEDAWNRAARIMDDMDILTMADGPHLELFARTYSAYKAAIEAMAKTGIVLIQKDKDGRPQAKRNPYAVEVHKNRDALHRLMIDMGMSPIARARIGLGFSQSNTDAASEFVA